MTKISDKKKNYVNQFIGYCKEYKKILVVNADNVGSNQMQKVRTALRGKAVVVFGKNTLMKKAVALSGNANLKTLVPFMKGNIGFVMTNGNLNDIKTVISNNKVSAPARVGQVSAVTVIVPAGNTNMEPTKTSFFQALNIPTKITKAMVEVVNDYTLLKPGQTVGQSEAQLLQMLNIKPFFYGLKIQKVYDDGELFDATILDQSDEEILAKFMNGVNSLAALSLQTGIITEAAVPHLVANRFKDLLAVAAVTAVSFKEAEEVKAYLADPSKFASAVAAPAPAAEPAKDAKKDDKKDAKKKVEEPPADEDADLGFGSLF